MHNQQHFNTCDLSVPYPRGRHMHASVGGRIKMSNDCATGGGCKPSITHVIFDLDGLLLGIIAS